MFSIEKTFFEVIMYYHTVYMLLAVISPESSLKNKWALLFLVCIYLYYNNRVRRVNRIAFIFNNVFLIGYTLYIALKCGFSQVLHVDYYSYVLLMYVFLTFSNVDVVMRFKKFLVCYHKKFLISTIMFFSLLLVSILIRNGLRVGQGSSIPVLYGPYSIPHGLAYSLIGIYCAVSILYNTYHKNFYLILKGVCILCTIWTATRSAVLALAFIIFADYLSIRKPRVKVMLVYIACIAFFYLLFFTDIITNNPLVQKTITAMGTGSITNGRERFAAIVMDYYYNFTTISEKVFGIGMEAVRGSLKNNPTVNVAIHAHNDYVNALCGYGVCGLLIYIGGQLLALKINKKVWNKLLLQLFLFILIYYNGLAMYMVLTPVLLIIYAFFLSAEENRKKYIKGECHE
ncbi:MAG: O-antigen ligase family protein [Lachnospiraceae bacterium]|nr:O-antigen ligase family protein [Lachnospiraceae bacterium]